MGPITLALVAALVTPTAALAPAARTAGFTSVALLPDGKVLVGRAAGAIDVLALATGEVEAAFARHAATVTRLALDPRGELVAAASTDGRVALWSLRVTSARGVVGYPGRYAAPTVVLHPSPEPWNEAVQVDWTADGAHLVTWSYDGLHRPSPTAAQLWTRAGELVWTGPHARQVDVHPTARRLALVTEGEVLLGWPGDGLQRIELAAAHDAVEFSPDGLRLAVGGKDRIWLLDAATGEVLRERDVKGLDPFGLHEWAHRLRWSPDGRRIGVVVGKGLNPAVVDGADLAPVWQGGLFGARMWFVFDVTWTPGGALVSGFGDVRAIDPSSGDARVIVEREEWWECAPLPRSGDVLLLTNAALYRLDPNVGTVRWRRES